MKSYESGIRKYKVRIIETLERTVEVEAKNQHHAEQSVSEKWKAGVYVLNADNFSDVKFNAA